MTHPFRQVPHAPDPRAETYHAAYPYAQLKSSEHPAKFAWWFVEHHVGELSVSEAWETAPDAIKALK